MKRVVLILALLLAVPAVSGAQTTPPPAPPAPQVPPVPPVPLVAPRVVVVPPVVDTVVIEDALRQAREVVRTVDMDAVREAVAAARVDTQVREQIDRAVQQVDRVRPVIVDMQDFHLNMPDWHMEMPDFYELQDRFATWNGNQDAAGGQYNMGLSALNNRKYEDAIVRFDKVIAQKAAHVEGAIYWKAFAQYKLGKTQESLDGIALLRKDYPKSQYLNDAKVLEVDARKMAGQPVDPSKMDDDDLKLLAIQGLQGTDPERAITACETVLGANNSLRVKKQALFLLATFSEPRAHQVLLSYAEGKGNPELQREALLRLASRGRQPTTAAEFKRIYESTTDVAIKSAIIDAYRVSGNKMELFNVAGNPGNVIDLRRQAVSGLSDIAAPQELMALYQKEENKDLRAQMVSVLSSMGAVDQLTQILKTEKEPTVRRTAIRSLGNQKTDKTGATLVQIYGTETDKDVKKAIISALGNQNNAEGLVGIVQKETAMDLKMAIVQKLSEMAPKSKVAADYLAELIKR